MEGRLKEGNEGINEGKREEGNKRDYHCRGGKKDGTKGVRIAEEYEMTDRKKGQKM
jgi:hypothetical protein